ncbi:CvpA family protein [Staphylococcus hyicus]|uniref:CvpA family protein n=2 Tax=Staphylococcus hyicus TaxID=1284 RepID=A0ACD5FLU1_STAHY|nr:CvpA family protein [Staphylococcus hyicus]MCQ9290398.1 CvpA family protein [Staphylococcus hyicus]MCQ9301026.1 CvpA family protein [Staphylococcus hyicus]MCQ9305640.1 CvpA family protein [Staphylococcus hyicus]MCQ9308052.1 CvpA family protein [Staphylococcus hyicus]MCQ9310474.1 CvpA family protein [Staphylococcus hyicus]
MFVVISGTFLLVYAALGFYRSFLASLLHLFSTVFAIWVGLQFYKSLYQYLKLFVPFPKTDAFHIHYALAFEQPEQEFNAVISLMVIMFIVKVLTHVVLDTFSELAYRHRNVFSLRIFGVITSVISGVIVLHFILLLMALYPDAMIQSSLQHATILKWLITDLPILSKITLTLT